DVRDARTRCRGWWHSSTLRLPIVLLMALERAGGSELPQLVTDHRVGDEHGNVLATVVHRDRVSDEGRQDHGAARPGLDHVVGTGLVLCFHLLEQVVVDERALLETARHGSVLPHRLPDLRRRTIIWSLALRLRVRPSGLPQGLTG